MSIEYVVYHGKYCAIGEKAWYQEFDRQKTALHAQGIKTELGQILLTGRDSDLLIIAFSNGVPVANGWGRLLKKYTHIDRIFVFPKDRGQNISVNMIRYFLKTRRGVIWNAVHDAMDHVAKKFGGIEKTVEGYRGWVLLATQYPGNLETELEHLDFWRYCDHCKLKVPEGSHCAACGTPFEVRFTDKMFQEQLRFLR